LASQQGWDSNIARHTRQKLIGTPYTFTLAITACSFRIRPHFSISTLKERSLTTATAVFGEKAKTTGNSFSCFLHHLSPILGIAIVKIPAETLKQRTILFKLILMLVNLFRSVSDIRKTSRNNEAER
jgi:hypothetical protein